MTHSYEEGALTLTNNDGATLCYPYNPETQNGWSNKEEALSYAYSRPMYFTKPLSEEEIRQLSVPNSISPRQARIVLLRAELLDDVEAAVATNREYQIYWEYALEIKRDDEMLRQMTAALGLTDEQVDGLFIEANKL